MLLKLLPSRVHTLKSQRMVQAMHKSMAQKINKISHLQAAENDDHHPQGVRVASLLHSLCLADPFGNVNHAGGRHHGVTHGHQKILWV